MKTTSKRDDIVKEAYEVFFEHGCHATGVDKLLENSGISKRTMYKYFRSKENLIAAAVTYYKDKTFEKVRIELEKRSEDPKEKILAIFDMRQEILAAGDFTGCFAINASLEYEGKNLEIKEACQSFVTEFEQFILYLCNQAELRDAENLARQIMILFEGTIVYGQSQRDPVVALLAKNVVQMLLIAHSQKV